MPERKSSFVNGCDDEIRKSWVWNKQILCFMSPFTYYQSSGGQVTSFSKRINLDF